MNRGIVIQKDDKAIRLLARRVGLGIEARPGLELAFARTLFLDPAIPIPWDLLGRGMDFLDNWEAAAPVWSYETLIADVATGEDRKRTEALIGDLRVPMYAHELLFVRDCEAGQALLAAWQEESAAGGDARVAFSRALYRIKPLFLALPRSWLTTAREGKRVVFHGPKKSPPVRPGASARKARKPAPELARVEVAPNRFISCRPGDEEKVKAEWVLAHTPRRERRAKK